jgi:NAD(P)-dependent dehydrogenase (short-subunit alcohol dehydrogenase family)
MLRRVGAAVVTGAGRGLGLEIARGLAERGLAVDVTDVDKAAAIAGAESIGGRAHGAELDVRDADACRTAAAAAADRAGSLDVWVNNAGVLITGYVWDHDADARRLMFDVNTFGTINGTLAALEHMRPANQGRVINVISLAGLGAPPGEAMYAATKHAAIAFSIGTLSDLRRAGATGVQISCLCPDGIWTPMIADKLDDPDAAPSFSGMLLEPSEVAERAVALLDKPRVVATYPRWRGGFVRLFDAFPGLAVRIIPMWYADAQRRQKRWKQRIESGKDPRFKARG